MPYRLLASKKLLQQKLLMQVEVVQEALLGHQVNYLNYYHIFIETLPTWHNVMCKYLGRCEYDERSRLQLWLLEDRGPGFYADISLRLPALRPLYTCLSPFPPRHVKDAANIGKVLPVSWGAQKTKCIGLFTGVVDS